jgi:hypothetical protein
MIELRHARARICATLVNTDAEDELGEGQYLLPISLRLESQLCLDRP